MTRYFLGVDTGATKSHALIADETGQALGFGQSGPGNPETIGYEGLTGVLQTAIDQALAAAGIASDQLSGAGLGIAGYDWPSQRPLILQSLQPLGLPASATEVVNDTIIGLLAGATEGWGVVVVAGTSCNCRGWDRNRREGRVTGFGSAMGEAAGSSELVAEAVRRVAFEWAQRGPPTCLTPAFIELAGAAGIEDLLEGLTLGRYRISPAAAPLVFRVAGKGDAVAREIIRWAGHELGQLATSVIRQLGFATLEFEVVLAGSFYNGGSLLIEAMAETIHAVAPGARLVRLNAPPVVGGVLLGMEQAGLEPSQLRQTLINSTNELLA